MRKKLFSILLAFSLVFSLAACGKDGGDAENGGGEPSYSEGSENSEGSAGVASGEAASEEKSDKKASKEGTFTVYRIGDNKLHFCLMSDLCETMVPKEDYGQGESSLIVLTENEKSAQFNGDSDYASYGFDRNGEWVSFSADYENGYKCFRNMFSATFQGDNLFEGFKDGDTFEAHVVNRNNWDLNEKNIAASGKINIVDISEDELTKIMEEEAKCYAAAKPANEVWVGNYLFDSYDYNKDEYVYGYAIVEVTEGGAISLALTDDKGTETFILEEKEYDEAHYDYGDVITGRAKEPGNNYGNELSLNIEPDYSYVNFSRMVNGTQLSYSLYKFNGDQSAPKDFEDKDKYGKVDAFVKNIPSSMLPGGTDDYAVLYRASDTAYVYNGSDYTQYPCESYAVYAFDKNGVNSLLTYTFCFDNEGAASAFYNYEVKNGYETSRSGNNVVYSVDGYESKKRITIDSYECEVYPGMHYAYVKQYEGEELNRNTLYISKPEATASYSFEDVCKMRMLKNGSHRSIDSQDASLYINFYYDNYSGTSSLSFDVYANDFYSANTVMKVVDERNYLSMGYNKYDGYICLNEYNIGETEATITQYQFKCSDFTNPSVSFDNYKSQTPENTVSHRFDMTRVE